MRDAGGSGVGESGLDEFAREQIEKARNDPRLTRGCGAAVGDYWEAMEEAEQTRMLSVLGIYELSGVLERHEREHGVSRDDVNFDPASKGEMQALWEQAELASAAIATDFAAVNAQALLAMNSALDAMVEEFAPAMRELAVGGMADHLMRAAEETNPEAAGALNDKSRAALKEALVQTLEGKLPKLGWLTGSGTERYEALARRRPRVGIGPADPRRLGRGSHRVRRDPKRSHASSRPHGRQGAPSGAKPLLPVRRGRLRPAETPRLQDLLCGDSVLRPGRRDAADAIVAGGY